MRKSQLALPLPGPIRHAPGQRLAGEALPLHAHGDDRAALGQPLQNGRPLSGEAAFNLGLRRLLRQPLLRELRELESAVPAQPLGVFRRGLYVEFFPSACPRR